MRHFEYEVIDVELIQEGRQRAPFALLNGLSAVIAEAEMHGAFALEGIKNTIDRGGCQRGVGGIARDVGFVDLQAVARQAGDLLCENAGDRHQESLEIAVVVIQQGARQHVRAGDGELERTAGNTGGEFAIGEEVERALGKGRLHDAGGLAAELHGAFAGEALVIAAPHLGAYAGHRTEEVFDHAVGIGMIDVEAIEFAIGGQIDARLALRVEDDAGGIEPRLLAGQGRQPIRNGIAAHGGGEDGGFRRHKGPGTWDG